MIWDPHVLHQPGPPEDCSECAINAKHAARWAAALADGPMTDSMSRDLSEQHRQDWCSWRPVSEPTVRHDKFAKISTFIVAHHGEEVTLQQVMDETDAAQGTAYAYIRDLALSFRRVGTSRYRVVDPVRARTEALAGSPATIAQDGSAVLGAVSSTDLAEIDPQRPKREPSKP